MNCVRQTCCTARPRTARPSESLGDRMSEAQPGPTVIETPRLLLRLPRLEDFEGYAELHADEEAARHIGGAMPRTAAWRKFLQQPGAWMVQGFAMFSVCDKASGEWLGQCGPWQ